MITTVPVARTTRIDDAQATVANSNVPTGRAGQDILAAQHRRRT